MADLSVAQRAALARLIERCPDHFLSPLSGLAGKMAGARSAALRDMVEAEATDRRRRNIAFGPLLPLFQARADGLPGPEFPAAVLTRLWRSATRNEPELLPQLDRGDDLSRMIADRLCLGAASALRDRAGEVWPDAPEGRAQALATCFDLAATARRALAFLPEWIGRPGNEAVAELKLALRQAAGVASDGAVWLLEILFAHLEDARLMLRVTALASSGEDGGAEVFVNRILMALARRAADVAAFDPSQAAGGAMGGAAAFKTDLDWCAATLTEIDVSLPLKADSAWGRAVRQARLKTALSLSERFSAAERAVDAVLPVERAALVGRMTRPRPRLDGPVDAAAADRARTLTAVVGLVRGPAAVFGCEAERRQTAEGLTGRLATWADEAMERLNDGQVADEATARRHIALSAELLALVGAQEASRTVRRRLMASGAASRASPPAA